MASATRIIHFSNDSRGKPRGFAVVATDYEDLGTPGVHTYINRLAWPQALLDAARTAKRLPDTSLASDGPVAPRGYSQGGGANAAAVELASGYAPGPTSGGRVRGRAPGRSPGPNQLGRDWCAQGAFFSPLPPPSGGPSVRPTVSDKVAEIAPPTPPVTPASTG